MADSKGRVTSVDVTPTEFNLLVTMMRAPVRALSRQFLLEQCLLDSDALERVVDTHIYNLRKKLESAGQSDVLLNVRVAWVTGFVSHESKTTPDALALALPAHSHSACHRHSFTDSPVHVAAIYCAVSLDHAPYAGSGTE